MVYYTCNDEGNLRELGFYGLVCGGDDFRQIMFLGG